MVQTIVTSANKEHIIGFDQPFTIIGERLNPTNRNKFLEELAAKDYSRVEKDALAQVAAGAHMLDVNAGIPPHMGSEPEILVDMIKLVQSLTDLPLAIDSSVIDALEAGLAVYQGRPLVNSVTGEEESLERVLPLVKKYDAAVVAISNDETGISKDPEVRYMVAKKIVERAEDYGIPRSQVVVDPLVMPLGAHEEGMTQTYTVQAFEIVKKMREDLRVNTTCGLSNVSFGLPNRHAMNGFFMCAAQAVGMTSAIMNPLMPIGERKILAHLEATAPELVPHFPKYNLEVTAALATDAMLGVDPMCQTWMARFRTPAPAGEGRGGRGGRRRRA